MAEMKKKNRNYSAANRKALFVKVKGGQRQEK